MCVCVSEMCLSVCVCACLNHYFYNCGNLWLLEMSQLIIRSVQYLSQVSQEYSTSINLVGENTFLIPTSRQMTSAIVQLSVLLQGPGQNILMRTRLPQALHEATSQSFTI